MNWGGGRAWWVATAAALLLLVGEAGFLVGRDDGRHSGSDVFRVSPGIADASPGGGTAYVDPGEPLNHQPYGFAYELPANVTWVDDNGNTHQGGEPPCLPYYHAVRVREIGAVQFSAGGGATTGTVLWVRC